MAEVLKLRSRDVEWRTVGDEVVVLDLASSTYVSVNAVGTAVWPLLVDGTTRDALVAAVVERFDVDEERAGRDLDAFVGQLDAAKLLERG